MRTIADPTAKIKRNAEIAAKSLHTYLVAAVSFGAAVLLALGPDWVTAFVQSHPTIAAGAPLVSFAFVLLGQLVPQDITLSSDRQRAAAAAAAWIRDLVARAVAPGQPLAVPPEIAKATGLPDVVHAPLSPAPVDTSLPMPGTAVMASLRKVVAPEPEPEPPAVDIRSQLAAEHPAWTAAQLDAAVEVYGARP